MREPTIARNYAEALFELGERAGETERYADLMEGFREVLQLEPTVRAILLSPRVPKPTKVRILSRAFSAYAPPKFAGFLGAVVRRGRQGILEAIVQEYLALVDAKFNRIHAGVTLARRPDAALQEAVRRKLSEVVGMEVIPHFHTDASILGGVIVRMGDRILDGSLRRRMVALRRRILRG